jgi:hypothetical protein
MLKRKPGLEKNQGPVSEVSKRSKLGREDEDSREHYYTAAANMFSHDDYTVEWICALPHRDGCCQGHARRCSRHPSDHNTYIVGRIDNHKIAIACLPSGVYGTTPATRIATQILSSFKSIRFGLMVGIEGRVPSRETDIRPGNTVASKSTESSGGVVQYDYRKAIGERSF